MATFVHFFVLLTLSLSLTFATNVSAAKPGIDLIHETCNHTLYYDFCVSSIQSDPESLKASVEGLAEIALNLAITNGTDTSLYISELLNDTLEPSLEQALSDCSQNYLDALDQLDDSLAALDSKGYNDLNAWVTAAMSDSDSCEMGFGDHPKHKSLLTQRNGDFSKLCSNVLAITGLLS